MSGFPLLRAAAAGMAAERGALDVAARNLALAQTGDAAHPAKRYEAEFTFALDDAADDAGDGGDAGPGILRFAGARPTDTDVDAVTEMVGILDAQRAYEANANLFATGRALTDKLIDLERT